jgi:hypothetical protein
MMYGENNEPLRDDASYDSVTVVIRTRFVARVSYTHPFPRDPVAASLSMRACGIITAERVHHSSVTSLHASSSTFLTTTRDRSPLCAFTVTGPSFHSLSPLLCMHSAQAVIPATYRSGMDPRNAHLPCHTEKRTSINEGWRRRTPLWGVLLLFLIVTPRGPRQFIFTLLSNDADQVNSSLKSPASPIEAVHGAVASEHESCSKIGVEVLRDGGNAVDAAVATTFCIGVVNMFS